MSTVAGGEGQGDGAINMVNTNTAITIATPTVSKSFKSTPGSLTLEHSGPHRCPYERTDNHR